MKSQRKEDLKANARVVEIFATQKNKRQVEERQLLQQIDAANEEMASLRSKIEEMETEKAESNRRVEELEEIIGFMPRRVGCEFEEEEDQFGGCGSRDFYCRDDGKNCNFGFTSKFLAFTYKFCAEKASV
ncbi:hypothetical protein Patl1_26395 [Pistacia atlantica]|uniref:Uncharacterized protein n=1 Tax=Pistacia atlantica TaxID=434234 RepID=A0ACC1B3I6_9ROSI|nr:hypothetical protein Patl1_26395 [Pistacia atlantica]